MGLESSPLPRHLFSLFLSITLLATLSWPDPGNLPYRQDYDQNVNISPEHAISISNGSLQSN